MMVVKEPQEMSDPVKNYPAINWHLPGMRPLQVGLVLSAIATSLAGILSNPLFTLANDSVTTTPILQATMVEQHQSQPSIKVSVAPEFGKK
jgi:NAD(P)H-quinone oxidoreductase subunit 2